MNSRVDIIMAKTQQINATIDATHILYDKQRLDAEFKKIGCKLTGSIHQKGEFTIRFDNGNSIVGITLADADSVLAQLASKAERSC